MGSPGDGVGKGRETEGGFDLVGQKGDFTSLTMNLNASLFGASSEFTVILLVVMERGWKDLCSPLAMRTGRMWSS